MILLTSCRGTPSGGSGGAASREARRGSSPSSPAEGRSRQISRRRFETVRDAWIESTRRGEIARGDQRGSTQQGGRRRVSDESDSVGGWECHLKQAVRARGIQVDGRRPRRSRQLQLQPRPRKHRRHQRRRRRAGRGHRAGHHTVTSRCHYYRRVGSNYLVFLEALLVYSTTTPRTFGLAGILPPSDRLEMFHWTEVVSLTLFPRQSP